MQPTLREQNCSNCRFSRRAAEFDDDHLLSCRYLPPQPYPSNEWRLVPETFWCGQWERGHKEPIRTVTRPPGEASSPGDWQDQHNSSGPGS